MKNISQKSEIIHKNLLFPYEDIKTKPEGKMLNTNMLVTTTSAIEGLKIKKYLQPISAHVVAGTNLFSDIGASLSDIFGFNNFEMNPEKVLDKLKSKVKILKENL
jgi:hypothetical protein